MPTPPAGTAGNSYSWRKPSTQAAFFRRLDQHGGEARRDAEHGAGIARGREFLGLGQGADADDGAFDLAHGADRPQAVPGAQRHFQHADSARHQGLGQRNGVLGIVDGDDGDHARRAHDFK
jgi:hypothetical protein